MKGRKGVIWGWQEECLGMVEVGGEFFQAPLGYCLGKVQVFPILENSFWCNASRALESFCTSTLDPFLNMGVLLGNFEAPGNEIIITIIFIVFWEYLSVLTTYCSFYSLRLCHKLLMVWNNPKETLWWIDFGSINLLLCMGFQLPFFSGLVCLTVPKVWHSWFTQCDIRISHSFAQVI